MSVCCDKCGEKLTPYEKHICEQEVSAVASNDGVSRARGYHRHIEGHNGHKLLTAGQGNIECKRGNCEINQPCDSEHMESSRNG